MCGILRCVIRVSASVVIVALMVPLTIFLLMYAISDTGLEWVDENGCGNARCHVLKDDNSGHVMFFRLSNYDNTNDVYKFLLIGNSLATKCEDEVDISIIRYSKKGDLLYRHKITSLLTNAVASCSLPSSCSPKSEGEVLLIKVNVSKSSSNDSIPQMAWQPKFKEIKARLICEKVRYFPTL